MTQKEYFTNLGCSPAIFKRSPEDSFFLEKTGKTAKEYRLDIFMQANDHFYRFRKAWKMSYISTKSKSVAQIDRHNDDMKMMVIEETKPRQTMRINEGQVVEFPWAEVFDRDIPLHTKYKGVYNVRFYDGQTDKETIEWFNSLSSDEKNKLNRIMSMLDEKYELISNRGEYYMLAEVIVIGYCIKCLFYNEDITQFDIASPENLLTKTVHRFVDVFSKCFTMRFKPAICENYKEKMYCGVVPCNNFRRRNDQRYFLNIDGYKFKTEFIWTDDINKYTK